MKKTIITLALATLSVAAFAQGKVTFDNTAALVRFTTDTTMLKTADKSLAGQLVPNVPSQIPSGSVIMIGLYSGTSAGTIGSGLTLQTAISVSGNDGNAAGNADTLNLLLSTPGGVKTYMEFAAWSGNYADYAVAPISEYKGIGTVFTMTPASGSQPYRSTSFGGSSTIDGNDIIISAVVPEPGTFALAGLGAAAMLIFRRRK